MKRLLRCALVLLSMAAAPARADITLPGYQHIGDFSNSSFTPADPVIRSLMKSNPTHFFLSQATTVTAVQLTDPNSVQNQLQVFIDNMNTPLAGSLSGGCGSGVNSTPCTYTLTTAIALSAGSHTIWPDGGCSSGARFAANCSSGEDDFSFSSIVLVSSATNFEVSDHRRRHLGDNTENGASKQWYKGTFYPDAPDGTSANIAFSINSARILSEVRFWRLRADNKTFSTSLTKPSVYLDGVFIGNLTAAASPFILSSGAALAAGAHTLSVVAGINSGGDRNDLSWDDAVLIMASNPATTPGSFNAVDSTQPPTNGRIQTRIAGANAAVDLAAITADGSGLLATYTGTVHVYLLDASTTTGVTTSGTNCDAGWVTVNNGVELGNTTFAVTDLGRKSFTFHYDDVLGNARLLLTDSSVTGCSTDNFAIRPDHFGTFLVTDNDQVSAGTTRNLATSGFTVSTTPIHNAGRPFTVQATAYNALGNVTASYAGSPTLSASATLAGMGNNLGVLSGGGSWTQSAGTVVTDHARYSEVGAVTAQLVDTTFAAVDAADTPTASLEVGPNSFDIGRFVPDHFTFTPVVDAQFAAGCGSGSYAYTYDGQPFYFTSTPSATVTAVDASGNTTTNYDGSLYKLSVSQQSNYSLGVTDSAYPAYTVASAPTTVSGVPTAPPGDNTFVNQGSGVSLYTVIPPASGYTLARGSTPLVPFKADIAIALNFTESDGVIFDSSTPGRFGTAAAGQGIPFALGGVSGADYNLFRFGRLAIDNTQGSERLPLAVPVRAEYYYESSASPFAAGWVTNLLDNGSSSGCTSAVLAVSSFDVQPDVAGSTSATALPAMGSGATTLTLSAPNVSEQVQLKALISGSGSLPWLLTGAAYDQNPAAVETFGLFKNEDQRIFQREVIGP